jgi:hypothetical protein
MTPTSLTVFFTFHKTGTLTEGDLDLAGVCESQNARFSDMVSDPTVLGLVMFSF